MIFEKPNLWAPIEPGRSLGGIKVDTPIRDYESLLISLYGENQSNFRLVTPLEAIYSPCGEAIHITVDVGSGQIVKVSAGPGYKGQLWGVIQIGIPIGEALKIRPDFYYFEPESTFYTQEMEGISFDPNIEDPTLDELSRCQVKYITVFSPRLINQSGLRNTGYERPVMQVDLTAD